MHKRAVHVKVESDTGLVHLLVVRDENDRLKTERVFTEQPLISFELIRESLSATDIKRINSL